MWEPSLNPARACFWVRWGPVIGIGCAVMACIDTKHTSAWLKVAAAVGATTGGSGASPIVAALRGPMKQRPPQNSTPPDPDELPVRAIVNIEKESITK